MHSEIGTVRQGPLLRILRPQHSHIHVLRAPYGNERQWRFPDCRDVMTEVADYPLLILRRGEERRLRGGHLWVFSNEVDVARTPLTAFQPGDPVMIVDHAGKPLGTGYAHPNTLICARLVDRAGHALDRSLIVHRLKIALSLRQRLYSEPYYRLVFGESDGLPGLTVDRFGAVVVAQATTAGMERLRDEITDALIKVLSPDVLVWKNDSSARVMEGLPESVQVVHGALPDRVVAREGGVEFACDLMEGQKTGWFYDQRGNRDRLQPYVAGAKVLDVFSYLGGWGLRSAAFGASTVDCVDVSARAVAGIRANVALNGFGDRVVAHAADAFDFLKAARAEKRKWDVVILDPPAFVKRKKDFKEGALAYRRLAEAGMQVLERDGILISCSCSHHMPRAALLDGMQQGARHLDRFMQVLEPLSQAPDHPVHPAIPETEYLKGYIARVVPA
jgi:23S rRNA (cytosine1962-C5)-methyltransferase